MDYVYWQVGTLEAQDLELTVETLRCRDAEKSSLVKKVVSIAKKE
jgi:hypothetical protein